MSDTRDPLTIFVEGPPQPINNRLWSPPVQYHVFADDAEREAEQAEISAWMRGGCKLTKQRKDKPMPTMELTLEQLANDYDWGEVFGEGGGGNCDKETESPDLTDTTPPNRSDVAEIIAAINGENDGPEWIGVFRLRDGRWLVASGGCDYTGWDCQAGNTLTVTSTLEAAISMGLTPDQALRLGLEHPGKLPS